MEHFFYVETITSFFILGRIFKTKLAHNLFFIEVFIGHCSLCSHEMNSTAEIVIMVKSWNVEQKINENKMEFYGFGIILL